MVARKNTAVAFLAILIIAWLVVLVTQVGAQTTDEQKQALIGEWRGLWGGYGRGSSTLIIHEINPAKAIARCTYTDAWLGEKKDPILADFIPGPDPKLEFKLEGNEFNFVLKKNILQGAFKGMRDGVREFRHQNGKIPGKMNLTGEVFSFRYKSQSPESWLFSFGG